MNSRSSTIRYDTIGSRYNAFRNADARIVRLLVDLLALPNHATIADIGAGTGNYSNALADGGYRLKSVEPSVVMRRQATPHPDVEWFAGTAEAIPLKSDSVDGVISTLAIHHFSDLSAASREYNRICPRGPIVLLTIDPRRGERYWFADYFPGIHRKTFNDFPPLDEVVAILRGDAPRMVDVTRFPLPADLTDLNMNAGWNRPEIYLDDTIREGMSGFALADPQEVEAGLSRLRSDLENGSWDAANGDLRRRESFDPGLAFVRLQHTAR